MAACHGAFPGVDTLTHVSQRRRWAVLVLLATAFFMTILDGTLTLSALPTVQRALGLDPAASKWIVTAYALAFGGLLMLGGRAADVFGRRRVFLIGVVVRLVASLIAGLAASGETLIAARALQGVGAAIIAPAALSLVLGTFPSGPERNRALGIWGGLGGIGATMGLLLGGVITDLLGWRWIFWVNVPIAATVLLLAPRFVPDARGRADHMLSLPSAVAISATLVLLIAAANTITSDGWTSRPSVALLGAAVVLVVAFWFAKGRGALRDQRRRMWFSRWLVGGNLLILMAGMAVDAMLITLTAYMQQVLGWSAAQFGVTASVMSATSVLGALASQRAITRWGVRPIAAAGAALMAVAGTLLTTVTGGPDSLPVVLTAMVLFGVGLSAVFVSGQISGLSHVAPETSGLAAGLIDTSFTVGSALGVAIGISVAAAGAAGSRASGAQALLSGQQASFGLVVVLALIGLGMALVLPGHRAGPAEGR